MPDSRNANIEDVFSGGEDEGPTCWCGNALEDMEDQIETGLCSHHAYYWYKDMQDHEPLPIDPRGRTARAVACLAPKIPTAIGRKRK